MTAAKPSRAARNRVITMALIGAGNRGRGVFGQYALDMPQCAKFVAVVEPEESRRNAFAAAHGIPKECCFSNYPDFFKGGRKLADAVVIATLEDERMGPSVAAMRLGYDILIEKPLGMKVREVVQITAAAKKFKGVFAVCHSMRYTPLLTTVKDLVDSGRFGKIVSLQHSENLSYSHMAHSFVRGLFNSERFTPMLLAKSCHDMDFLHYLVGSAPEKISCFGSLSHFVRRNAPAGAPAFCLEGCPAEAKCPYHVLKLYFNEDSDPAYIRQMGVIKDKRELLEALRTNRFGRCVYRCDNDVVDHQVVQILFKNGVTASFCMVGLNAVERRMSKISLENGEITVDVSAGEIQAWTFSPDVKSTLCPASLGGTHLGGDRLVMNRFVEAVRTRNRKGLPSTVDDSFAGHLMVFAAEEARRTGQVVDVAAYERRVKKGPLFSRVD